VKVRRLRRSRQLRPNSREIRELRAWSPLPVGTGRNKDPRGDGRDLAAIDQGSGEGARREWIVAAGIGAA
jgi:hypothetical protein